MVELVYTTVSETVPPGTEGSTPSEVTSQEGKSGNENVTRVTPYFDGVILGTSNWFYGGN